MECQLPSINSLNLIVDTAKMSRRVQQTYQDHFNDVDVDVEIKANTKGGVYLPFPEKLFQMLTHIDLYEPDLACIVSWRPHGRCFLVRDTGRFEENILSRFFKMTKYTSFRRQLNLWGFKRLVHKTPDFDASTKSSAFATSHLCIVACNVIRT